jgi:hypothetical protein
VHGHTELDEQTHTSAPDERITGVGA